MSLMWELSPMHYAERIERLYIRLPVTDALALERTVLANERTWLAYLRTALAVIVSGVSGAQFLDKDLFVVLGYVFAGVGVLLIAWGFYRFRTSRDKTLTLFERLEQEH